MVLKFSLFQIAFNILSLPLKSVLNFLFSLFIVNETEFALLAPNTTLLMYALLFPALNIAEP